jgi:hypothetical protein
VLHFKSTFTNQQIFEKYLNKNKSHKDLNPKRQAGKREFKNE